MRACGSPLERGQTAWVCARGHSFDIARRGYVNLLQPQDRRAAVPGDTADAIAARGRLLDAGIGRTILDGIVGVARDTGLDDASVVVDLGCGRGDALAAIAAATRAPGIGIDLSSAAIAEAARRAPHLTWVVANADRRLPLLGGTVRLVLSLHARRNPAESARVLAAGGWLLVAVPAADDLLELREQVLGTPLTRERAATVVEEHEAHFTLASRTRLGERAALTREPLLDLLRGTYRGIRTATAGQVAALQALDVTLASEVLLFRRR